MGRLLPVGKDALFGSTGAITPEKFGAFSFSKRSHNAAFHGPGVNDDSSDLKDYQDSLVYTFILDNFAPGARVLEVGGGDSRVIRALGERYHFTNLDKFEGGGNGLRDIRRSPAEARLVQAHLGDFSPLLDDGSFDLVFSISVLEHTSGLPARMAELAADQRRVLKPGGYALHAIDSRVGVDAGGRVSHSWVPPIVPYLFGLPEALNEIAFLDHIVADPDFWHMPKAQYMRTWHGTTDKPWDEFGRPFSYNVLSRKAAAPA